MQFAALRHAKAWSMHVKADQEEYVDASWRVSFYIRYNGFGFSLCRYQGTGFSRAAV
jgi:hypothetical protein